MRRHLTVATAACAVGAGLLAAAALGAGGTASGPQSASATGGTLRIDNKSDFDYVDPSLAYFSHSWQLENAVQLKLVGYPDKEAPAGSRLVAQAATGMPIVAKDGKTYTFTVRKGFRFSDGKPVTAANYAYAINRALNPKMQSPAASYLEDMVGATAVLDGKATRASGVVASGQKLTIRLSKVAPDFVTRMSMTFFGAIPLNLPVDSNGVGAPLVSAGPYYVKEWTPRRSALVVRNPFWNNKKEPWKSLGRPANVDAFAYTFGNALEAQKLRIETNATDLGQIPPASVAELAQKYGLNKSRLFIRHRSTIWYLALNTDRPLFKNNAKLRQAINWAIDRPQLTRQYGYLGGVRTDQSLPPGFPGFRDWNIYPLQGVNSRSLAKARSLAQGNTRDGKAVFYAFNNSPGPEVAQIVQYNLKQIGIDVDVRLFDRVVQNSKAGTRGEAFDITHEGWGADYADPSTFVNKLFDGSTIQAANNNDISYLNDQKINAAIHRAAIMSGDQRIQAYSTLDRDITRDAAPLAVFLADNVRQLVSPSTGCYTFDPINGTANIVALCKK